MELLIPNSSPPQKEIAEISTLIFNFPAIVFPWDPWCLALHRHILVVSQELKKTLCTYFEDSTSDIPFIMGLPHFGIPKLPSLMSQRLSFSYSGSLQRHTLQMKSVYEGKWFKCIFNLSWKSLISLSFYLLWSLTNAFQLLFFILYPEFM